MFPTLFSTCTCTAIACIENAYSQDLGSSKTYVNVDVFSLA